MQRTCLAAIVLALLAWRQGRVVASLELGASFLGPFVAVPVGDPHGEQPGPDLGLPVDTLSYLIQKRVSIGTVIRFSNDIAVRLEMHSLAQPSKDGALASTFAYATGKLVVALPQELQVGLPTKTIEGLHGAVTFDLIRIQQLRSPEAIDGLAPAGCLVDGSENRSYYFSQLAVQKLRRAQENGASEPSWMGAPFREEMAPIVAAITTLQDAERVAELIKRASPTSREKALLWKFFAWTILSPNWPQLLCLTGFDIISLRSSQVRESFASVGEDLVEYLLSCEPLLRALQEDDWIVLCKAGSPMSARELASIFRRASPMQTCTTISHWISAAARYVAAETLGSEADFFKEALAREGELGCSSRDAWLPSAWSRITALPLKVYEEGGPERCGAFLSYFRLLLRHCGRSLASLEPTAPTSGAPHHIQAIAQNIGFAAFLAGAPLERDTMAILRAGVLASQARAQMFLFATDVYLQAGEHLGQQGWEGLPRDHPLMVMASLVDEALLVASGRSSLLKRPAEGPNGDVPPLRLSEKIEQVALCASFHVASLWLAYARRYVYAELPTYMEQLHRIQPSPLSKVADFRVLALFLAIAPNLAADVYSAPKPVCPQMEMLFLAIATMAYMPIYEVEERARALTAYHSGPGGAACDPFVKMAPVPPPTHIRWPPQLFTLPPFEAISLLRAFAYLHLDISFDVTGEMTPLDALTDTDGWKECKDEDGMVCAGKDREFEGIYPKRHYEPLVNFWVRSARSLGPSESRGSSGEWIAEPEGIIFTKVPSPYTAVRRRDRPPPQAYTGEFGDLNAKELPFLSTKGTPKATTTHPNSLPCKIPS